MKVVKQEGFKDCGVSCLLSVIRYYKGNVSIEYLRELTSTTKNGVTAFNLVLAANTLGFNSYGLKDSIENITEDMLPIISHVIINKSYQHFIVIYQIDSIKKQILIMDPAFGKKKISFAEFNLMTSNNFIYLKPIKKLLNLEKKKIVNEWLYVFIKNNKKYFPYIILLTIIYFILNTISAFYFKLLLNKAINYNIINNVFIISKFILTIYILKEIFLYLKNLTLLKWSELLDEELTKNVFKRLMFLPYLYYKNRTSGEVISRMKDLNVIKSFITKLFSSFTTDFIIVITFFFILLSINERLTFLIVFFNIIYFIINIFLNRIISFHLNHYLQREDKINSILYETLSSVDSIKHLHIEKMKTNMFFKEYQILLEKAYNVNKYILLDNLITNINNNISNVIFLTIGSILIIKNEFSIGSIIVFQNILSIYLNSYENIILLSKEYYKYKISKGRIEDLFTIKTENFNCLSYFDSCNLDGTIKINNLTYSYSYNKIFDGLNLTIRKKDKIFLRGDSGIGKSTLMKILARFINIESGIITINNIDLMHYHLDVVRRGITYVSQQENLFTDTLKNNILLNRDDDNFREACHITQVDSLVTDLGYSMMVEEAGSNFSGGERQRIILARSLMKNSEIYIFDEATNQLDINKEREILDGILKYLKDKIVIVISHRIVNMDLFNRVLTLKDGKIYEDI